MFLGCSRPAKVIAKGGLVALDLDYHENDNAAVTVTACQHRTIIDYILVGNI